MTERRPSSEELFINPDTRRQITELMQTPTWDTKETLLGARSVEFVQVERDLPEPPEAAHIRQTAWSNKLEERKRVLEQSNPNNRYEIRPRGKDDFPTEPALFEESTEKPIMYVGPTITLAQQGIVWEESNVKIPVYPIKYTEWIACYDPHYTEAFQNNELPLPYAGMGASVLMETTDGFMPLTRRGLETPVYPGMLYSAGGGPKPGQTSVEALMEEIVEETGLRPGEHFDPANLTMLAAVTDSKFADSQHSRPELVSYLPVHVSFRDMQEIQYQTAKEKGRETDVWDIEPFSLFEPTFTKRLALHGQEMCPPTEAGIAHAELFRTAQREGLQIAERNIEEVMQGLNSYTRHPFVPPIDRLK